jgi:hypothetical protein
MEMEMDQKDKGIKLELILKSKDPKKILLNFNNPKTLTLIIKILILVKT